MSAFAKQLRELRVDPAGRRWVYVPYDQLTDRVGPLAETPPADLGVILVESRWKPARRPYHKQKLALVLANQRHFALEQARRGVAVRYLAGAAGYAEQLRPVLAELGPASVMEPAERELRVELAPLVAEGLLAVAPHRGWLTTPEQFRAACPAGKPFRMDAFYRKVRQDSGILMAGGKPIGGKYSHDAENRQAWKGEPPAAAPPTFRPDTVTTEVGELVNRLYARHPGAVDLAHLPATQADADALWAWAKRDCLPRFGPFEDAMSTRSTNLFHTRISAVLNLHRLAPAQVVADVVAMDLPLPSKEGFVRQILGWREFVRHVHRATDGFRELPGMAEVPIADLTGDGGWSGWAGTPWPTPPGGSAGQDGGAAPAFLGAGGLVPPALWGAPSGMACLDNTIRDVWAEAYGHHITRLMVVANLMSLLDVSPRALTDWFWVAYADAYDWVVEPNVLGMGTFAAGDVMTTKPYVSGAAYLDRMGDHCAGCRFDPKRDCPVTRLYWAYLDRHADRLAGNQRMALPLKAAAKRSAAERAADAAVFERVRAALAAGRLA